MSRGGHGCPQADDGGEQGLINDERLMITDCPWLLCEPNEKEGRKSLAEILQGGNFGQYDNEIPNVYQHSYIMLPKYKKRAVFGTKRLKCSKSISKNIVL